MARSDLTGKRFGMLTAVRYSHTEMPNWRAMWICKCDCGREKAVAGRHLTSGASASCGCRVGSAVTHGKSDTRVYNIWMKMHSRCSDRGNNRYDRYGGRGIRVCRRWKSFEAFYADMGEPGPRMSIDRVDNNGNYTPENCRWASSTEQARNRAPRRKTKK